MSLLKMNHIQKGFDGLDVIKDISLEVREGEILSIIGPSGSGKTTLLNIIGGLDRYDSGDLIINNVIFYHIFEQNKLIF